MRVQRKARKKEKLRAQRKAEKEKAKADKKKKIAEDWVKHHDRRQYYGDCIATNGQITSNKLDQQSDEC